MRLQVPAEPGTPPGSPPQTANTVHGVPADREVVQEIHDAPPVEEHVGKIYAWNKDTAVPLTYTPRDLTAPLQSSMEQLKQHIALVEEEKKQVRNVGSLHSLFIVCASSWFFSQVVYWSLDLTSRECHTTVDRGTRDTVGGFARRARQQVLAANVHRRISSAVSVYAVMFYAVSAPCC